MFITSLEELRSSLYNELKTSEGAVGIILANKLVMGRVGFNFPISLRASLSISLRASLSSCHGLCFWSRQYQPQTQQMAKIAVGRRRCSLSSSYWLSCLGLTHMVFCFSNGIGVTLLQSSSRLFLVFFFNGLVYSHLG
ncbi:Uncharacterized protein Rs2_21019 [Raphanus sativus]|nr:Uncharacterized protein Rs2_21019 [Raphanus sativus]